MITELVKKNISWSTFLVGSYVSLIYLTGVTRYKNLFLILMLITSIFYLYKNPKIYFGALRNKIFFALCFFAFAVIYSIFISKNPELSFNEMKTPFFRDVFFVSILIFFLLYKEDNLKINKMILCGFFIGLFLITSKEIYLYCMDYKDNIMPFSNYNHRSVSDGIVFFFPVLLSIWYLIKKNNYFRLLSIILFSILVLFALLGTLSRGAWLAVFSMYILILLLNRDWKIFIITLILGTAIFSIIKLEKDNNKSLLLTKMEQLDSSHRYKNGTQGSALTLILENPIWGYGAGNKIYDSVYNSNVVNHKEWTFENSLGPHNIYLTVWFSSGIIGILSFLYLVFTYIKEAAILVLSKNKYTKQASIMLVVSFIGYFIVRGNFESVHLNILGVYLGFLMSVIANNDSRLS
ncbi:O-antigen ligase RfaL [Photorhabdus stackebrandtii]|uniref:O-antigen ligase RfaL n=1 Tax=Photorhabdus stackebrandtii TaxID=1123042 RepID=A0A7X5TMB3_9GAMM|nr:O-antigen ligase RfaL [Photorhabdus stackebrandtii]NHB97970.1 O-antigen ligase RfaL [Photorhabdus stackebrandtii]